MIYLGLEILRIEHELLFFRNLLYQLYFLKQEPFFYEWLGVTHTLSLQMQFNSFLWEKSIQTSGGSRVSQNKL